MKTIICALFSYSLAQQGEQVFNIKDQFQSLTQQQVIKDENVLQDRPIIAVLSHGMRSTFVNDFPELSAYQSYVSDGYVKFVESAGARVVPLIFNNHTTEAQILDVLTHANGLLMPGGGTVSGYTAWEKQVYNLAFELNVSGTHFPIFGICLGLQKIVQYTHGSSLLDNHLLKQANRAITFTVADLATTKLFGDIESYFLVKSDFENNEAFFHSHNYGVTTSVFNGQTSMTDNFDIISTEVDALGVEFVNIIEHKTYPIFGTMFHPEKAVSAMSKFNNFGHSMEGAQLNRYFADMFIREAKKNNHGFTTYS